LNNPQETAVVIFSAITGLASVIAVLVTVTQGILVVLISGIFGALLSPFAAFQQIKLTQTVVIQETNVSYWAGFFGGALSR
jgi:hypothetical protein